MLISCLIACCCLYILCFVWYCWDSTYFCFFFTMWHMWTLISFSFSLIPPRVLLACLSPWIETWNVVFVCSFCFHILCFVFVIFLYFWFTSQSAPFPAFKICSLFWNWKLRIVWRKTHFWRKKGSCLKQQGERREILGRILLHCFWVLERERERERKSRWVSWAKINKFEKIPRELWVLGEKRKLE